LYHIFNLIDRCQAPFFKPFAVPHPLTPCATAQAGGGGRFVAVGRKGKPPYSSVQGQYKQVDMEGLL